MSYQPFILKYRPRAFDDVVGQEHVSRTLRNALSSGRLVHAYLFTGPRGTGKTTMARILARALNCVNGPTPDPCGVCDQCRDIIEGRSMDVVEMDAATHRGIDDIRELREKVKYAPSGSHCKLYILDECHMLTTEANNALLKTLEEPPPHAYFALLTTESHKILPTILSRCQRFDFRPVSVTDTVQMLRRIAEAEGLQVQEEALAAIAHAAEGGMRDAESIFEQVVAFSEGEVTLEIASQVLGVTDAETLLEIAWVVARQDLGGVFSLVDRLVGEGKNLPRLVEDLTTFFRDLLRMTLSGGGGMIWLQLGPNGEQRMREVAETAGSERLLAAVHSLAELLVKLKDSSQHALLLELALTELANPAATVRSTPRPAPQPAAPQPAATQPAAPMPAPAAQAPPAPAVQPPPAPAPAVPQAQPATPAPVASAPPVAEPPPVRPAPVPLDGPVTCDLIRANWQRLLDQLRVNVRAFLIEAVPTELEGERLILSLPPTYGFHVVQIKTHAETIQGALQSVFGRSFKVQARVSDEPVTPPGQIPASTLPADAAAPYAPDLPEEPEPVTQAPVEASEAPAPAPASPPAEPQPAPEPDFALQPGQAPDPAQGMSGDSAVAQTLSLFPGSQEVGPPDANHQ